MAEQDLFGNNEILQDNNLNKKIEFAINLIRSASAKAQETGQVIEVCYSGGKDSDVILELTKMSGVPYRAIYKNTTIDQPGTPAHARKNGVEIVMPKMSFIELIGKYGLPNRYRRFCCKELKEYKIMDYAVLGIRKEESIKRNERYQEPEACRVFSKTEKVKQYYPILYWTSKDIAEFVKLRNLKCHPYYYDEQGLLHTERRVGCMCCPLQSFGKRKEEFIRHPQMVNLYLRAMKPYYDKHRMGDKFNNVYEWFIREVFCEKQKDYDRLFKDRLFGNDLDCKQFLRDYFKTNIVNL